MVAKAETPRPEILLDLGEGLEIWRVHLDRTREQDENARTMNKPMFERLTETIGRDKRLESLPLAAGLVDDDGPQGVEIISGHHRIRSARAAGLDTAHFLVDVTGLDRDQIRAKQLAHNSIAGVDDPEILARIYTAIENVDARLEAFIDEKELADMARAPAIPNLDLGVQFRVVQLVFLPTQADRFKRALEQLGPIEGTTDELYLADVALFDLWKLALARTRQSYEITAATTAVARMSAIVLEHLKGETPDDVELVPLPDLLGAGAIPGEAADVVRQAIEKAIENEDVTKRAPWRLLELLCADYLAGA